MLILDGGTGRELARIGAPFRQPEWSALALIEAPEFVSRVHQRYVDAGADVITTNSYALVPFHIGQERFDAQGAMLADRAGALARAVADTAPRVMRVAGSLPPVSGSYRPDLIDLARSRAVLSVLVGALAAHVDLWLAETLSAVVEAELVADCVAGTGAPLWLSFTLADEDLAAPPMLRSGETVAQAAIAARRLGAEALLFNCSQPEVMATAITAAREALGDHAANDHAALPIGVYANAFPPQGADAEANSGLSPIRADLTPEGYAALAQGWASAGAGIIGGCCGIGPEHIAQLHAALR